MLTSGLLSIVFLIILFDGGVSDLSESVNDFTKSVYDVFRASDGNVFVSPLSIQIALSMLQNGAEGNTLQQIQQGARMPNDKSTINQAMAVLKYDLTQHRQKGLELNIANKIFVSQNIRLVDEFQYILREYYQAPVASVNFNNGQRAADEINHWASQNTHGKIREVVSSDNFDDATVAVLLNAIYFKARWLSPFDKTKTKFQDFYFNEYGTKKVKFMTLEHSRLCPRFDKNLDSWIVELDYVGSKFNMVLIVPNTMEGWRQVEEQLPSIDLGELLSLKGCSFYEVTLKMPKFRIKKHIDLQAALEQLGMSDMFNQDLADFSSLAEPTERNIYINKATQDSFLNVDETETEAAAVTSLGVAMASSYISPANLPHITIIADKPFLFLINFVQHQTVTPLFIGRLSEP